jgi:hypothetical protein
MQKAIENFQPFAETSRFTIRFDCTYTETQVEVEPRAEFDEHRSRSNQLVLRERTPVTGPTVRSIQI